ncbi:MAG TPA: hypothetical protein VFU22_25420 [Roseiflexaceae bacterium]|nr:hypothetical protein [Roseiflexaceae bacterium]
MSRKVSPKRSASARPLIIAIVVIAVVAVAIVVAATRRTAQPTQQATAPHLVDLSQQDHHGATSGRALIVARLGETVPGISGETGPLMTTLVRGQYPDGATQATVRTDENCAADAEGVSHCLNELDLGGTTIVVQHHHKMSLTPCLTPGETVKLMTVAEYQAKS